MLLVVIDTNVLLVSVSSKSKYHWLYQAVIKKKIGIAFTNAILNEYEEKIAEHWHPDVAANVIRSLIELPTSINVAVYFNLRVIITDEDDNKFVDCAFAANADWIITNDKDFNILKKLPFPQIPVTKIDDFKKELIKQGIIKQEDNF